jgi:hypothetical protein
MFLIREAGVEVLNEVVLNQVLVSFRTDEQTGRVIEAVQSDGACWCGGTIWEPTYLVRSYTRSW